MRLADSLLMVTQDSNILVGLVVSRDLLLNSSILGRVLQLFLECPGSVVCSENLRSQTWHIASQMFVECRCLHDAGSAFILKYPSVTYGKAVEQIVFLRLWFGLEYLDVFEHLRIDFDYLLVQNTIFTQEG